MQVKMAELYEAGRSQEEVATALGVSGATVSRWMARAGLEARPASRRSYPSPLAAILAKLGPRPRDEEECWEWPAARTTQGYGLITWKRENYQVSRVLAEHWFGALGDRLVCHHCDNPPCCRPSHLFIGTYSQNTQDMLQKGRNRS